MKYATKFLENNMNTLIIPLFILAVTLGCAGLQEADAEEMFPLIRISEVDVNVNDFEKTNNVIVNLLFNEKT